ncbi:MAG TPA: Bcr/CflA family drug resistance efflux transporter, partial [Chitinophagaceae bacterium]
FALIALGIISASQLNNLALKHSSSERIIQVASFCQSCIGILFAVLAFLGLANLYLTVFLIFLFLGCQGFIFPNASALSLAHFGHNAGSASALLGAVQMSIGAGASALVSLLQNQTAVPMAVVMATCASAALLVFLLGRKIILAKAGAENIAEENVEMATTL